MNVKIKVKRNVASVADTTATVSMLLSFSSATVDSNTIQNYNVIIIMIIPENNNKTHGLDALLNLLLHSKSLGSGYYNSPFPMHVDEFGPATHIYGQAVPQLKCMFGPRYWKSLFTCSFIA